MFGEAFHCWTETLTFLLETLILAFGNAVCYLSWKISILYILCLSFCEHFRSKQSVWSALFIIDGRDKLSDSRQNVLKNTDFQLAQIRLELLVIIYLYLSDSGSVWTITKSDFEIFENSH